MFAASPNAQYLDSKTALENKSIDSESPEFSRQFKRWDKNEILKSDLETAKNLAVLCFNDCTN